jgi:hypothetical protein
VEGQPVVEQIAAAPRNAQDRPNADIKMTKVTIEE